jgi:hypothetical protein
MTDKDIPRPLRRQLILRCTFDDDVCGPAERDRILTHCFPGLDREQTLPVLQQIKQLRRAGNTSQAEALVAELIQRDREART